MAFTYQKIGRHLICVDQNLATAIKVFCFDHAANELGALGFGKENALAALKAIARHKLLKRDDARLIELPVFGNLGIRVHHGSKVFDLERGEVCKIFDASFPKDRMREEVDASRIASAVAAAPRHIMADSEFTWLRESYIAGRNATGQVRDNSSDYLRYYQDVEDCLGDLIQLQEPITVSLADHLDMHDRDSFEQRWSAVGISGTKIDLIQAYLDELRRWLIDAASEDKLQLVLTHGDFSLVNAIETNKGLRFIDWEGIGFGGLYSDVFNFVFVERYYGRTSESFSEELETYLATYRHTVRSTLPNLQMAANQSLLYARRLYYFERLCLLVEREVSRNLCDVVLNSIELFKNYDDEKSETISLTQESAVRHA